MPRPGEPHWAQAELPVLELQSLGPPSHTVPLGYCCISLQLHTALTLASLFASHIFILLLCWACIVVLSYFIQHFYVLEAVCKTDDAEREPPHISSFCLIASWSQNSIKCCLIMEVVTIIHSI